MYKKVRFTNGSEHTAGLIFDELELAKMSISDISRLFPYSESPKMRRIEFSPPFISWEGCFNHQFVSE